MPVRRALVECVVLSVQEGCVFYPCCKQCFSRIDLRHDTARCRCSRCGSSCLRQQVDYRYRLSMTVARDRRIFGMTVFGGCLNALFGIHASGLQRLVEDSDKSGESPVRSVLLVKAVEDCFIGRHFIFGIKLTDAENGPLFGRPTLGDSSAQFIANQILLPRGTGPGGCSVVSYYQALLQRATEHPLGTTTGPFIASRPSATTALLPAPHQSPSASFNNTTLPASCLLSTSRRRSLNSQHILSPTPPWQQSLGLITSSAEQEDGCSTQASAGERTHYQTHNNSRALHPAPVGNRGLRGKHDTTTDPARVPSSPSLSVYLSSSSCGASPASSIREGDENTPVLHAWLSPSQPGPSRTVPLGFGTREGSSDGEQQTEQANASLSDSVAWEDIFSESLGLFLCEEDNGDVDDRICKTGPNLVSLCQGVATSGNPLPADSQAVEAVSVCQSNARLTGTHPHRSILLEITNAVDRSHGVDPGPNLSPQTYRNLSWNENESLKEEGSLSASFSGDEELPSVRSCDQDGAYDCSADLFNSSLAQTPRAQRNTDSHFDEDSQAHTQEMPDCKTSPDMVHCDISYVADTQAQNNDARSTMEDCDHFQCLDFVPPSQSTPLVKRAGHTGLLVPTHVNHASGLMNLQPNRVDSYGSHMCTPLRTTTTLRRLNSLRAHPHQTNCAKQSLPFSVEPRKRSLKSKRSKSSFLRLDHRSKRSVILAQKGPAEKTGPNLTCDTSVCDESGLCDNDDTCKTRGPVKCRPRELTDNSMGDFENTLRGQRTDKQVNYIDMTTTPSKTELVHRRIGNGVCNQPGERAGSSSQNTSGVEVNLDGSVGHLADEESGAYDLSRDLFTDSF